MWPHMQAPKGAAHSLVSCMMSCSGARARVVFTLLTCTACRHLVVRDHWADLAAKRGNAFVLASEASKVSESVLARAESLWDTLFSGGATKASQTAQDVMKTRPVSPTRGPSKTENCTESSRVGKAGKGGGKDKGGKGKSKEWGKRWATDDKEQEGRADKRQKGACFLCGKLDHFARDCPSKSTA